MTMDPQHPLDDRLAAYADGVADALTDAPLRAHVTSCDRCALVVRDLGALRVALADLPDLVPSRPLRFLPPVDAPAMPSGGFAALVRRLFAPALVAGAALVLVGSVGMAAPTATALLAGKAGAGGAASDYLTNDSRTEGVTPGQGSPASAHDPGQRSQVAVETAPPPRSAGSGRIDEVGARPVAPMPWLALTILGAAIVIASLVMRWTVVPAAGTRGPPSL